MYLESISQFYVRRMVFVLGYARVSCIMEWRLAFGEVYIGV